MVTAWQVKHKRKDGQCI